MAPQTEVLPLALLVVVLVGVILAVVVMMIVGVLPFFSFLDSICLVYFHYVLPELVVVVDHLLVHLREFRPALLDLAPFLLHLVTVMVAVFVMLFVKVFAVMVARLEKQQLAF